MERDLFLIYLLAVVVLFSLAYLALRLRRQAKAIATRRQATDQCWYGTASVTGAVPLTPTALTPALSHGERAGGQPEAEDGAWASTTSAMTWGR